MCDKVVCLPICRSASEVLFTEVLDLSFRKPNSLIFRKKKFDGVARAELKTYPLAQGNAGQRRGALWLRYEAPVARLHHRQARAAAVRKGQDSSLNTF